MLSYDIKQLVEDADISKVIDFLHIEVTRSGAASYIRCPKHKDTHVSNCYFKEGQNFLYCFSCGARINAIDLIMSEGFDFKEAANLLWEMEGEPGFSKKMVKIKIPVLESREKTRLNAELKHGETYNRKTRNYRIEKTVCAEWEDFF